ncbi:predicted protein [Streptomyces viridochromogenes DSM 40736]|uniref:Predicted protein n=1 Tax=Streptomyces viridochromogenes (strain DSM 40736 / JCM 4977 / BCRC 1201 / Tue 494) TaxID=591159 RepID=D9X3H1_STRVT|nr:predicted protein [Streptomyces viridochromogenes DSM 40736]
MIPHTGELSHTRRDPVSARADPEGLAKARGAAVHCAVPGTGDHPWGTLPSTLHNPEITP